MNNLFNALKRLDQYDSISNRTTLNRPRLRNPLRQGLQSRGGQIPNNMGSGVKDDVPAMLTAGEFVMSKPAVQKYGANNLNAMNNNALRPGNNPMEFPADDLAILEYPERRNISRPKQDDIPILEYNKGGMVPKYNMGGMVPQSGYQSNMTMRKPGSGGPRDMGIPTLGSLFRPWKKY